MVNQLKPGYFLGDARSIEAAGAIFSEVTHASARSLPDHGHEWPFVCMLLGGSYSEAADQTTITFKPFSAVFHGARLTHRDVIGDAGARFFIIEFGELWKDTIDRLGGSPQRIYEMYGEGASWPALRAYHAFITGSHEDGVYEEILFEICGYLPKAPAPDPAAPPWLANVQKILVRDFRETYALRAVAGQVHVDPSHLARTFYRFKGCTMGEFVTRLRVQAACQELASLDTPLEIVAHASGFSDQSHMTRAIRRLCGSTPAVLRRTLQETARRI